MRYSDALICASGMEQTVGAAPSSAVTYVTPAYKSEPLVFDF